MLQTWVHTSGRTHMTEAPSRLVRHGRLGNCSDTTLEKLSHHFRETKKNTVKSSEDCRGFAFSNSITSPETSTSIKNAEAAKPLHHVFSDFVELAKQASLRKAMYFATFLVSSGGYSVVRFICCADELAKAVTDAVQDLLKLFKNEEKSMISNDGNVFEWFLADNDGSIMDMQFDFR